MKPLVFPLHAAAELTQAILADQTIEQGFIEHRRFPDGESYVRLGAPVAGRPVVLLCGLDRPDEWLMPLLLAADAAREQDARTVGLVAPYLAYMRQDRAFHRGEAISAQSFAAILSSHFDWLVTLEPHLHRFGSLDQVFSIPTNAADASRPIGEWIAKNVERPCLIGPDRESAQWIKRIARVTGADFAVLDKVRLGDREVEITGDLGKLDAGMTPVVVDDIVSSGATMNAIVGLVAKHFTACPIYIAVHALSPDVASNQPDGDAECDVRFVSCSSVAHPSNRIDVSAPLIAGVHAMLEISSGGMCS